MPCTPLHVHTEHSSLDGLARLKDTAQECRKLGVKPLPGVDVYLAIRSRHAPKTMNVYADEGMGDADDEFTTDGTLRTKKKSYYHLTVLARNRTGWHNRMRFHNESQQTKKGKHPLCDWVRYRLSSLSHADDMGSAPGI